MTLKERSNDKEHNKKTGYNGQEKGENRQIKRRKWVKKERKQEKLVEK